jgi:C4-dicarboxylate-specific signal transduction histidine kinase
VAAVLSVAVALGIARVLDIYLVSSPVLLFLCAVMFGGWFGGAAPGLLAVALSVLAFDYYFVPPLASFGVGITEVPRTVIFALSAIFVALLSAAQRRATESLRDARDDLSQTVQELRKANETLHSEYAERKRAEEALREAQVDLARVNRVTTMGELTASLAHEVNQPIAAALTNANTCLLWLARETPDIDEARDAAKRIVQDGTRAAEVISRIRLLFQKGTPQREWVDVNDVIREIIVLLRNEATRSAISVRAELAADLPPMMGDRVQLQQVMMNLIMNSIDAMKDVDGARELTIASRRGGTEQIMVSVTDTGVGLPPQQADEIFKAFFTTKAHGTGMGLSISRSIVESHGGRLWAADNGPRGASFHVALPTTTDTP